MIGDAVDARGFDRRIKIERKVSGRDAMGGETISYVLRREMWASVIFTRGREAYLSSQVTEATDIEFRVRYKPDIEVTDRVVFDGTPYDIQYLAEMGRRRKLRILAKQPGATPT
jgi:SPP1 family predicted phage head-tail adaptor